MNSGFTVVEGSNEIVWNLVIDKHIFFLSKQSSTAAQATMEPSCQSPGLEDNPEGASPEDAGSLDNVGVAACNGLPSLLAINSAASRKTDGQVESVKVPATLAAQSSISNKKKPSSEELEGLVNNCSQDYDQYDSSDSATSPAKL